MNPAFFSLGLKPSGLLGLIYKRVPNNTFNHCNNFRVLVQDPKGVFSVPSSSSGGLAGNVVPTVPVVSPWSLPPRPFLPLPLSNTFNPTLLSTVPSTIPSAIPSYLTPSVSC